MVEEKITNAKALNDEILTTMDKLSELLLESHVYGFNMTRMMEHNGKKHEINIQFDVDGSCFGKRRYSGRYDWEY